MRRTTTFWLRHADRDVLAATPCRANSSLTARGDGVDVDDLALDDRAHRQVDARVVDEADPRAGRLHLGDTYVVGADVEPDRRRTGPEGEQGQRKSSLDRCCI